jgi:hypothetical protein
MKALEWTLRIAMFGEFLGHGMFAFHVAPHFVPLLTQTVGFSTETAQGLLPVIGVIDFVIAGLALVWPIRIVLLYGAVWGFLTALARPWSGREIWDFVERWPNCGVPLALLLVRGLPAERRDWFR